MQIEKNLNPYCRSVCPPFKNVFFFLWMFHLYSVECHVFHTVRLFSHKLLKVFVSAVLNNVGVGKHVFLTSLTGLYCELGDILCPADKLVKWNISVFMYVPLVCMSLCPWARYWTPELLMCWSAPCIAATAISVWMYVWITVSRFGQKYLLNVMYSGIFNEVEGVNAIESISMW